MSPHLSPPPSAHPGTLHFIPPNLSAFEPTKQPPSHSNPPTNPAPTNTLLWIGGLFDTPLSTTYPLALAAALPPTWNLATASLGSAGHSWGTSSIAQDAKDIAKIVDYFRSIRPAEGEKEKGEGRGKVVIMGHSTGCQDCMEYLVGAGSSQRPAVEGVVLQAPVSDREALGAAMAGAALREANEIAVGMCEDGREGDGLPNRLTRGVFGRIGITARRWVDIAMEGGADDYFSSDLTDEELRGTFGRVGAGGTPVLVLFSGCEENVAEGLDKEGLVGRWMGVVEGGGGRVDRVDGGVVPGATHNLNGCSEAVVDDLVQRVVRFIGRLDGGDFLGGSKM
ncbi:hypothetical protein LTS16_001405 [Friedmanniomyces endolithicus]|uniref:AB hydrolase-1 domain-containing protein n=1 Tax=Friedmanniomyces endolithicus TaxID=329885 RepID=A0A4U0V3S0_9PEZI|nr:hypothetical protein LTS09_006737 [Friedmanniomyces endolithicus]KAK0282887.1 hypothetical protein LTR35_006679 [Friedmanniomyces endolithicus]KAK0297057.1 hypothetical protein LTS00_004336 [Friedmanniomyces endolithicus]KAK0320733.1 hypothetical protein LTR82_008446 [Friedmanniomyces endolithicus]KAK0833689.1 hypothetical protein LTR73_001452 [Friedmanniomyces endolithicus]